MTKEEIFSICLLLAGALLAAVSQVLLKKAAMQPACSRLGEYLNPLVISGYLLLLFTTLLTVFAYQYLPLSLGPVLNASSYLYVAVFGALFFKERLTRQKLLGLCLILGGIFVYSLWG